MAPSHETTLFVMNVLPLTAEELADGSACDNEEPDRSNEPSE